MFTPEASIEELDREHLRSGATGLALSIFIHVPIVWALAAVNSTPSKIGLNPSNAVVVELVSEAMLEPSLEEVSDLPQGQDFETTAGGKDSLVVPKKFDDSTEVPVETAKVLAPLSAINEKENQIAEGQIRHHKKQNIDAAPTSSPKASKPPGPVEEEHPVPPQNSYKADSGATRGVLVDMTPLSTEATTDLSRSVATRGGGSSSQMPGTENALEQALAAAGLNSLRRTLLPKSTTSGTDESYSGCRVQLVRTGSHSPLRPMDLNALNAAVRQLTSNMKRKDVFSFHTNKEGWSRPFNPGSQSLNDLLAPKASEHVFGEGKIAKTLEGEAARWRYWQVRDRSAWQSVLRTDQGQRAQRLAQSFGVQFVANCGSN